MAELSITNVVSIQVATPPAGLNDYQINNLAIFTKEAPVNESIGAYAIYLSPTDVATDWGTESEVYSMAVAIFSQTPNILNGNGSLIIFPMIGSGLTLEQAIIDGRAQIFFGGALWAGYDADDMEITDAAEYCQTQRIMLFVSSYLAASLDDGELFANLKAESLTQARMLLYTTSALAARKMAAAYAGRAMSTNFSGSATTATMHMKDLVTVLPDDGITQTILEKCKTVGVDVYCNMASLPKVFSTGGNDFYDNVYNLNWLVFSLEVAGFNAIATTSTKLPQTEPGIAVLRGAYINVLNQAVSNGFIAPGAWNSPELFGNPDDLKQAVREIGYYVYNTPVNLQSQTDRAERKAPLIQVAIKYAGAIHSSAVVVNVNA